MGKISGSEFPAISISDAIEICRTVYDKPFGGMISEESLASKLGHSTIKSGGFQNKITALRRYGLITENEKIELTDLARKIVKPVSKDEEIRYILAAFENIPLFKKIHEKLGDKLPDDSFWTILFEITNDRDKSAKYAEFIKKLYLDGAKYYREGIHSMIAPVSVVSLGSMSQEFIDAKLGDVYIKLPATEESVDIAKNLIQMLEKQVKSKKK